MVTAPWLLWRLFCGIQLLCVCVFFFYFRQSLGCSGQVLARRALVHSSRSLIRPVWLWLVPWGPSLPLGSMARPTGSWIVMRGKDSSYGALLHSVRSWLALQGQVRSTVPRGPNQFREALICPARSQVTPAGPCSCFVHRVLICPLGSCSVPRDPYSSCRGAWRGPWG